MEKETKKNVISPGSQSLCVLVVGSTIQARIVIQINGKAEIPPELMQAIVKAIEET